MIFTSALARAANSALVLLTLFGSAAASSQEVIPDFYKEPGLSTSRDLTDQHEAEHIDPFTGSLQLHYTDIHVPGNGGFGLDVVRSYNSSTVIETNPDAYVGQAGVGWTIHFGRVLSKLAPLPCAPAGFGQNAANNPVIETPDGSRQILYLVGTPTMMTTQYWKAECAANGIGLIVYSPDGIRYDMTQQVDVSVGTFNQIAWYTTKITDRNGNYATINYDGVASAQISTVTTSDGRGLNFTYTSGLIHTIATTGLGGSTYTYNYTLVPGSATSYNLSSVLRPDGTYWKYTYNGSLGTTAGSYAMRQVTFPEAGTLTYEYSYVFFDSSSNPASRSTVVQTKTASDVGTWTFSYTPGSYGVYDATSVSGPEGTVIYHHVGPNYAQLGSVWQIGLLMSKTLGTVQSEVYTWGKIKISNQINMRPGAFSVKTDPEVDVPFLSTKITVRDGATYSLAVNAYDNWGKPTHTTESGSGGGKRVTNLGYYSDGTLWIVDEPQSQVVTNGLSVSKSFDATGNIASVVKDGVLTSYTRFPTGDIKQATFPRTLVHNYSNYKRGQAQTEVQPEGINITRVIDDVGNMTSYTNGELHTTSYAYDGLNRIKAITYPIGNAVAITYTSTTKSAVRGGLTEATSYDGFGRVTSITLGGVATTYKYDSAGRLTFASNPGDSVGTTYGNFDVLGRYHSVSNADATSRSINYGSGTKTVVNERTKSTTDSFLGYSDPDEVYVTAVAAAEPTANVTIGRDAWNRVHTITQAGLTRTYGFNSNGYLISVDNPEASFTYGRDAAGNMTQRVDNGGAGSGATYTYDNQNRLSGESYSGWLPVRATIRTYTRTNKLKTVNASGQWASNMVYGYDSNDNLHTKAVTVDSQTFTTTIGYNTNDQVAYLSYPYSSTVVSYAPDVLGRPTSVSSFIKSVAYWPSGQIKTLTYGNQTISSYGQNNRLWPSNFSTVMGSTRYANSAYVYDGVGNLNSITDSIDASYSRTLGYDNIDRLITASGPWGTGAITYDGAGNIKSQNLGSYGLTYTYDSHGMLTTLAGSRASSFVHDWNGNVTSAYGNTYAYDEVPNLSCVNCSGGTSGTQYGYDGNNKRLDIFKAGVLTYELYGPHDTLLVEYTPSTGASIEYFYLGNKRVAQRVNSGPSASQTIVGTAPVGTVAMSIPVSAAVVGTAAPTGSVDFFEGANLLGTAKVDASTGFATTTIRFSSAGSHTISATYRGDSLNKASTSTLNATVAVSAQTVVDARPNPSGPHYYYTASTTVGSKSPTGNVSFYNNGAFVGTAAPNTATGIATISGYTDGSGYDSVSAIYPGDANNPGVTSIATRLNETPDSYYVTAKSYPLNITAVAGQPFRLYEVCKPSLPFNYSFVPLPSTYVQAIISDGSTSLGGGAYDQNLGATSFNITLTTVGTHNIEIDCGGGGPYLRTANSQTVTVTK